jgi:short-subunit dehydrogenase
VHTEFQEKAGMSPRFFARAQSVDEVIAASLRGLRKKKALVWTSLFQRFFSLCSDLSPNSIRRWVAARVLELCGAGKS